MTNDFYAGILAGISLVIAGFILFQLGLNFGLRAAINLLEEYPAARNSLLKTKRSASVLPYVIKNGSSND